ncbi:hypothetical protein FSP39_023882 [Pinctada imbricata]|uniref:Eukaryotic peptide chain release factor subunit 1 n=1 Tax=Pinctada imbricata TaxID=66713 RepID=A0AA88Y1I4_PINIB|nr:hypothetical protein FSP39_023882 [Pinctada imbricata]
MDGKGALFATLTGNSKEILHKFSVVLPPKHGRGGQSAPRFGRIRMQKRQHFVLKVAEEATKLFISGDKPNIAGLVLAGSADLKNELAEANVFDARLRPMIIKTVDIAYGGESGLNEAIVLSADVLGNLKFIQEKKMLERYFEEIAQDTGRFCYGIQDTMQALEMGAVDRLMVWEELDVTRYTMKNNTTDVTTTLFLKSGQEKDQTFFIDKQTGTDLEIMDEILLTDWLVENYTSYGASLDIITNKTAEGNQFVRGFGGIGGMLLETRMISDTHRKIV